MELYEEIKIRTGWGGLPNILYVNREIAVCQAGIESIDDKLEHGPELTQKDGKRIAEQYGKLESRLGRLMYLAERIKADLYYD